MDDDSMRVGPMSACQGSACQVVTACMQGLHVITLSRINKPTQGVALQNKIGGGSTSLAASDGTNEPLRRVGPWRHHRREAREATRGGARHEKAAATSML